MIKNAFPFAVWCILRFIISIVVIDLQIYGWYNTISIRYKGVSFMRRTFAQVLKEGKVDIKNEYTKLYNLFYTPNIRDGKSLADIISDNFYVFHFRGTCLTLDEFDRMHEIRFVEYPQKFDIDYLVSFCEYIFNFISQLSDRFFYSDFNKHRIINHILCVVETIGYMRSEEDDITIFVPKDGIAIAISESELVPQKMSYKVISYNHHSMSGDLEGKKQILLSFADTLEALRPRLKEADKQLESDLFYAFNNFNVRHNNIDPAGTKYKKPVADLTDIQMEECYDNVYQMCLLAFMVLDDVDQRKIFNELKDKIINRG